MLFNTFSFFFKSSFSKKNSSIRFDGLLQQNLLIFDCKMYYQHNVLSLIYTCSKHTLVFVR